MSARLTGFLNYYGSLSSPVFEDILKGMENDKADKPPEASSPRRVRLTLMAQHVVAALVENRSGTLSRVSGLFSRRGFNIDSLTVGETEDTSISRMTIAVSGDERVLEQIVKQLSKLVDVIAVRVLDPSSCLRREIMLVKISADEKARPAVLGIAGIFRARIVDVSPSTITIEATGDKEKLNGLLLLLRPYGILELARTGLVALERGSAVLSIPAVPVPVLSIT